MEDELLLGTTNRAKAERLRWVFDGLGFVLRDLPAGLGSGPNEDGSTFRENAERKAEHWSARLGGLVVATDGGMVVPGLGAAWDALRTARAAGPEADDLGRARHLLGLARGLDGDRRAVFWSEALALARDGRPVASWQAEGTRAVLVEQLDPDALLAGFWAASLCYLPTFGTTLAALDDEQRKRADPTWGRLREMVRDHFSSG